MSREDYTSMSHRKTSFASQRDRIYDLYEIYRKRKQELGGYDAAERCVILQAHPDKTYANCFKQPEHMH